MLDAEGGLGIDVGHGAVGQHDLRVLDSSHYVFVCFFPKWFLLFLSGKRERSAVMYEEVCVVGVSVGMELNEEKVEMK